MTSYVALLRGINVGRAKRVAMADLRALLANLGYSGVRTLLNSGNALFCAEVGAPDVHADRIRQALVSELKVGAAVVVKSADEFAAVVSENPLLGLATDPSRLLVAFTQQPAALAGLAGLVGGDWSPEALAVGHGAAYLWCPNGVIDSRLVQAVSRELGDLATTRNWSTVSALAELL